MSNDKLGMMFSEVMSGGFALNQTDPETGAKAGKSQPLTMHGTITIDDLDAFIADPKHLGAQIGFFAVLHTWGSAMTHHPHLHCVVPGGGIAVAGSGAPRGR